MGRPSADEVLAVLQYEAKHLAAATRWVGEHRDRMDAHAPDAVLILEGGLVHVRCLLEFTNGKWIKEPKKGQPNRTTPWDRDVWAQDIAPTYTYPARRNRLDALHNRISATLSHMSRTRPERLYRWDLPRCCNLIADRLDEIASHCEEQSRSSVTTCAKELRRAGAVDAVRSVSTSSTTSQVITSSTN